ncbi:MAG: leucine dehydrogenase [Bacteroidota bacterium]|nr:leucine dehydrogenase [Bacteroidota bacterium]MDX5447659.1 leucine dehydrogenase [Bacteroidota bacterium]MDX5506590.1 leucine dehydrogenase [Bacteroidota bacterium]
MSINEVLEQAREEGVFSSISFKGHEQIVFCHDEETGLRAIIGIHSTVLGPALGGTRMWNYANEQDAIRDVLRLSRGMTFKASISGLNLGGGKAVIIGDSRKDKTDALMARFGKFVDSLSGRYITAEDVGINTHDMEIVKGQTDHVTGIPESMGGSGDPSPVTAYGVFMGMKASARYKWGSDDLTGKKVLVQGVGHVGETLVKHLSDAGAKVMIIDIHDDTLERVASQYNATIVRDSDIYGIDMDIYAPCALGATLNDDTIPALKAGIVAGAANNQLADELRHGNMLRDRGIIYAPDFLINAGGLINVYSEIAKYDRSEALRRTENIYDTTLDTLQLSKKEGITTHQAALRRAQERIDQARK